MPRPIARIMGARRRQRLKDARDERLQADIKRREADARKKAEEGKKKE